MRSFKTISLLFVCLLSFQTANAEWIKQNTGTFAWFKDVFFLNDSKGWIVGGDGVILSTPDGGTTWRKHPKVTTDNFNQIHFTSETEGWLLCERNVYNRGKEAPTYLRKTVDGGLSWEKIEFEDADRERVTKLLFKKDGSARAFGEGGVFYQLQEDGRTWRRYKTAIHYLLLDGAFADETIGAIVGAGGTIMFTEDSGLTWERASLLGDNDTRFHAVYFTGQKGAWAVGTKGRIFRSNGGGRLWRQQDSTVTANLNDVYFTSATSGWAVGDHGIIVRTRDSGQNWNDVNSHVTHKLERITFAAGRGWAVGFGGTVLTYQDGPDNNDRGTKPSLQKRG